MLVQMKDTGGLAQHERNRRQHQHSDDRCQRRRATGATPRLRQRSASPGYWLHARFACLTVVGIFSRHRSRAKSTSEVQYADNACTNARSLLLLATGLPSETSRGYVCTLTHHLLLSLLSLSTSPLEGQKPSSSGQAVSTLSSLFPDSARAAFLGERSCVPTTTRRRRRQRRSGGGTTQRHAHHKGRRR